MTKIVSDTDARQGRWGRQVLIVLIVALILAFAAWGAAEFYGELIDTGTPAGQAQTPNG